MKWENKMSRESQTLKKNFFRKSNLKNNYRETKLTTEKKLQKKSLR